MFEDLLALIIRLYNEGRMQGTVNNPFAQFGLRPRVYLGAQILPERQVDSNMFREMEVRYQSYIANDAARFSPVQMKTGGQLVGDMLVELGDADIGYEMTGRDYDALLGYLGRSGSFDAEAAALNPAERMISDPLKALNEKHRWDAMANAQVERRGDNGYYELVDYPNPPGQRVNAAGVWSSDSYDPIPDIVAVHEAAADDGQVIIRTITSPAVVQKLLRNQNVKNQVQGMSEGTNYNGFIGLPALNAYLIGLGLSAIETYDSRYETANGVGRFLPAGTMIFLGATGRSEIIEPPIDEEGDAVYLEDTQGYFAIGRAAGQQNPGVVVYVEAFQNKPPRVEYEGWQTMLPVLQSPQAIRAIKQIS